jgi:hypothetical protein
VIVHFLSVGWAIFFVKISTKKSPHSSVAVTSHCDCEDVGSIPTVGIFLHFSFLHYANHVLSFIAVDIMH